MMRYLIWLFFGIGAAAVASVLYRTRSPRELLGTLLVGVGGALLGGLVGSFVLVASEPSAAHATFAAVVGAVLALAVAHLVGGARQGPPRSLA